MSRTPQTILLDTDTLAYRPLLSRCARAGSEVLDRTVIEESKEREANMEKFLESLEFTSESRFLNLQEILEHIIKEDNCDPALMDAAMAKLALARERSKHD